MPARSGLPTALCSRGAMKPYDAHMTPITGLHHVTVTSSRGGPLIEFFRGRLGLRLVKRTVNFDDPSTWHLYFADDVGSPGSVITHFPVGDLPRGVRGRGEIAEASYAVAADRFEQLVDMLGRTPDVSRRTRFGEDALVMTDPDGSGVAVVALPADDPRVASFTARRGDAIGLGGLAGVVITVADAPLLSDVLTGALGLRSAGRDGAFERFRAGAASIDLEHAPEHSPRRRGAGTIHHVAFAVADDEALADVGQRLTDVGLHPTPVRERVYFRSVYCMVPGGALFEFATAGPGFMVDESHEALGTTICLPPWLEAQRDEIVSHLPKLPA